jgi:hypothetical protein
MFKIRLQRNKDTIIGAAVTIGVVILFIINVFTLLGPLIAAYAPEKQVSSTSPIDKQAVDAAINFLSE